MIVTIINISPLLRGRSFVCSAIFPFFVFFATSLAHLTKEISQFLHAKRSRIAFHAGAEGVGRDFWNVAFRDANIGKTSRHADSVAEIFRVFEESLFAARTDMQCIGTLMVSDFGFM